MSHATRPGNVCLALAGSYPGLPAHAMSYNRDVFPEIARSVVKQAQAPHRTGHRPWPRPRRPWFMAQTWKHLLFAHWPVPLEQLRPAVPTEIPIDTYEDQAWLGITPFEVIALRLHWTVPVPVLSAFPELNVRTYVTVEGKPGIYFFSLDAASRLAVAAARHMYRLPYFPARMSLDHRGDSILYESRRTQDDAPAAEFAARYRPIGDPFNSHPGSLEHWLTERYCLYTLDEQRRVLRGEIQHPPWSLQVAEATMTRNTMGRELALRLEGPPLVHYAERQDVVFWRLDSIS
jgi:uncharacterized protein